MRMVRIRRSIVAKIFVGLALCTPWAWRAQAATTVGTSAATFYNPIMDENADPFMTEWNHHYYLTATTGNNITVWSNDNMTNIATGSEQVVWTPSGHESNFADIWSPELFHDGQRWYIYFAADISGNNNTHRDYVLESSADNPDSTYRFVGEVSDPSNQWMIDPAPLQLNGKLYLLWSGWASVKNQTQRLYIAPMSSPTKISGVRHVISSPTYSWEKSVAPINEGPVVLQHEGKTFIVYSANASWTNSYCLGMLSLVGDNPLNASDWEKSSSPVFKSANGVYGPGRASFVTSENGQQFWMVYHAARYNKAGWDRTIRAQPFTWDSNGTPNFGSPISLTDSLPLPAGESLNRTTYMPTVKDGHATFQVTVPKAGMYGLYVRYRNTTGSTATQAFSVNGVVQLPLTVPVTGPSMDSVLSTFVTLPKGVSKMSFSENSYTAQIVQIDLTTTVT